MATLCNMAGHIYFHPVISFYLLFFPRLISAATDWMSTIILHMAWPWCEFRMHVWNVRYAARCKYRTQKSRQKSPSGHHRTTLLGYKAISSQLRHVSTIGKNLLSSNMSSTCPLNMVNFGPLVAEIFSLVWAFGAPLQISTGFTSWQRYCTAL